MPTEPKSFLASYGRTAILILVSLISVFYAIQFVAVTFVSDAVVMAMVVSGTLLMLGIRYLLKKPFKPFIYVLLFSIFTGGVHAVTTTLLVNTLFASGSFTTAELPVLSKSGHLGKSSHDTPTVSVQLEGIPKDISFPFGLASRIASADTVVIDYRRGALGLQVMNARVNFK